MTKLAKLEPSHPAPDKKPAAPKLTRRRSNSQCEAYCPPSDEYDLDHILHAQIAKLTGGLSPISLTLAGFDWWARLMLSPTKIHKLQQSLLEKTGQINSYAAQALSGNATAPVTPPHADHRFISDGWKNFPFNVFEQGFLLSQSWWDESTSSVRGVSPHHLNIADMPASARYTPPGQWQANTPSKEGSWWEDWQSWPKAHSRGKTKPPAMGNTKDYQPLDDAPGRYVMMK